MAYKIAIGSSDELNVDLKFGEVNEFLIYSVDGLSVELVERRKVDQEETVKSECQSSSCSSEGCSGSGHGCSGPSDIVPKVELIRDCRCVVCKKVGFQAQKQFEKRAISVFDVECEVKEAIEKITGYYEKIDNKKLLRRS